MDGLEVGFEGGKASLSYDWDGNVKVSIEVALIALLEKYAESTDNTVDDKIVDWAKDYLGDKLK